MNAACLGSTGKSPSGTRRSSLKTRIGELLDAGAADWKIVSARLRKLDAKSLSGISAPGFVVTLNIDNLCRCPMIV